MKTMKSILSFTSLLVALAAIAVPAKAQVTFTGSGVADGGGANGEAISSVVVNNDASTISFTINSTAAMSAYVFYAIEIQKIGGPVGDTGLFNPWSPHIGISTGENALINTWQTGATPGTFSGGVWTMGSGAAYTAGGTGSTFASMTFALSSLGLNVGDSFYLDVVSGYTGSPAGQAAYGALDNTGYLPESDNSYQPWLGSNFYDSATSAGTTFGTTATKYTIVAVPEPATLALLSGGVILLLAQRRRVAGSRAA